MTDWIDKLTDLRRLRATGAIDEAQFEARRVLILSERDAGGPRPAPAPPPPTPPGPEVSPLEVEPLPEPPLVDAASGVAPEQPPSALKPPAPPPPPQVGAVYRTPSAAGESQTPARAAGKPSKWIWLTGAGVAVVALIALAAFSLQPKRPPAPLFPITRYDAPRQERVLSVGLNVRTGPGSTYAKTAAEPLSMGQTISAIGEITANDGGRWAYVQLPGGSVGYVNARLLGSASTGTAGAMNIGTEAAVADAKSVAEAYWRDWSADDDPDGAKVGRDYADEVTFYGRALTREQVLAQKQAFARRWPAREYVVRAGSMSATCPDAVRCTLTGIVDWKCSDPTTGRASAGAARFQFGIENKHLSSETGVVLNRSAREG